MSNKTVLQFKTNKDKPDTTHNGKKCVMLAHGESGHAHAFYGEDTVLFDGKQLTVKSTDTLSHEEHTGQVVHPGLGECTIQREYTKGTIKRVID